MTELTHTRTRIRRRDSTPKSRWKSPKSSYLPSPDSFTGIDTGPSPVDKRPTDGVDRRRDSSVGTKGPCFLRPRKPSTPSLEPPSFSITPGRVPRTRPILWGITWEVGSDRQSGRLWAVPQTTDGPGTNPSRRTDLTGIRLYWGGSVPGPLPDGTSKGTYPLTSDKISLGLSPGVHVCHTPSLEIRPQRSGPKVPIWGSGLFNKSS